MWQGEVVEREHWFEPTRFQCVYDTHIVSHCSVVPTTRLGLEVVDPPADFLNLFDLLA